MEITSGETTDFRMAFDQIHRVLLEMCKQIHASAEQNNDSLIRDIVLFIDNNYANSNLCLTSVATKFNLNETYLSKAFKESVGLNFSKYVEKSRMEKAVELLSTNKYSISEVTEKVGYNSPHAFRRAFKRYYHKNPSDEKQ